MSPVGAGHCRVNTRCCAFLLGGGGSVACLAPLPHLRGFWKVPPAARCSLFHMLVFLLLSHHRCALLQAVALHSPRPCRPALASGHSTLCFILLSRISVVSCDGVWHATFDGVVSCVGRGPCSRLTDAQPEQERLGTVCRAMLASGLWSSFRFSCACPGAHSLTGSGVGGGHHVFSVPSGLAHTPLLCFVPPHWENTDQFLQALHLTWLCWTFLSLGGAPGCRPHAVSCPGAARSAAQLPSARLAGDVTSSCCVISKFLVGRCLDTV